MWAFFSQQKKSPLLLIILCMITTHKKHEHSLQHWFVIMCKIQKTIKSHIHFVIIISGHFFDCILYLSLYFEFLSNRIFFVPFLLTSQNNNIKIVEPSSLCPANFYCLSLNHGDKRKVCFYLHNFIQRLLTFWLACPLIHKNFHQRASTTLCIEREI